MNCKGLSVPILCQAPLADETEQSPVGSGTQKPFCGSPFLPIWNKLQPPGPSLSSKGRVQTVAHQGREEVQSPHQEGAIKGQKCSLEAGAQFPLEDYT